MERISRDYGSVKRRTVAALRRFDRPVQVREISKVIYPDKNPIQASKNLYHTLKRLEKEGKVEHVSTGVWQVASNDE